MSPHFFFLLKVIFAKNRSPLYLIYKIPSNNFLVESFCFTLSMLKSFYVLLGQFLSKHYATLFSLSLSKISLNQLQFLETPEKHICHIPDMFLIYSSKTIYLFLVPTFLVQIKMFFVVMQSGQSGTTSDFNGAL